MPGMTLTGEKKSIDDVSDFVCAWRASSIGPEESTACCGGGCRADMLAKGCMPSYREVIDGVGRSVVVRGCMARAWRYGSLLLAGIG